MNLRGEFSVSFAVEFDDPAIYRLLRYGDRWGSAWTFPC